MYNLPRSDNIFKVNYLFFIICVSLLLYQSINLLMEFMSGKTVVNISVEVIRNTSLPTITLCRSGSDFSRLALLNNNVSKLYEQYLKQSENTNKSIYNEINLNKVHYKLWTKALEIYFYSNENYFKIKDILETVEPSINNTKKTSFYAFFLQSSAYGKIDKDLIKNGQDYKLKSLPMESYKIWHHGKFPRIIKCYTLFTHSESSWNNIKMVFARFYIYILWDSVQKFPTITLDFFMHSQNTMPYEGLTFVNFGYKYIIKYSKWSIIRLGKGYDTDCREYDPKKYTRNDCIYDCYQQRGKFYCQTENFVSSYIFKKKKYFEQNNLNLSKCFIKNEIRHEIIEFCYKQCNLECDINYYSFTIDKIQEMEFYKNNFLFEPSYMPDLTIRHIPEMPLLTFICNFGGILGMWLGVSFFDILNRLWNLIRLKILIWFSINNMNITNNHIFINRMIRHH